jgi:hypothetical protein
VVVKQNGDIEAAALLSSDGRVERMPSIDQLVEGVATHPSLYALLSFSAHGHTFAARKVISEDMTVKSSGSGLPPESVLLLLCLVGNMEGVGGDRPMDWCRRWTSIPVH